MQNIIRLVQKFQIVLLFVFLQVLCFVLLIVGDNPFHRASIASSSNVVSGTIYTYTNYITAYFHLKKENEQLIQENNLLKSQLLGHQIKVGTSYIIVNDTVYHLQYDFLTAKVINSSKTSRHNYLTLNVGLEHKVAVNDGVIGTQGIIGRVAAVSKSYATVIPIINEHFQLAVRHRGSNSFGKLVWTDTDNYLTATVLDVASNAPVNVGDIIETRGSDGVFPEGYPVGRVLKVEPVQGETYQLIQIGLLEDFGAVYNVNIVKNLKKVEQVQLEQETLDQISK